MNSWNRTPREIYDAIEHLWRNSWNNLLRMLWYYIKWNYNKFTREISEGFPIEFLDEFLEELPESYLRQILLQNWGNSWKNIRNATPGESAKRLQGIFSGRDAEGNLEEIKAKTSAKIPEGIFGRYWINLWDNSWRHFQKNNRKIIPKNS